MAKICIVDDHTLFRRGTQMFIESLGHEIVGSFENGKEFLEFMESNGSTDIVFLDLEMPVLDGWETAKILAEKFPGVKILMISMHSSIQIISDLMSINIDGYLLKNAAPEEVELAIEKVMKGKIYLDDSGIIAIVETLRAYDRKRKTILTSKEIEVLKKLLQGKTSRQIGDELGIVQSTVETHKKNIVDKAGLKNAKELVKYAKDLKLDES